MEINFRKNIFYHILLIFKSIENQENASIADECKEGLKDENMNRIQHDAGKNKGIEKNVDEKGNLQETKA